MFRLYMYPHAVLDVRSSILCDIVTYSPLGLIVMQISLM